MDPVRLGALLGRNQSFERFDPATGVPEDWLAVGSTAMFASVGSASPLHSSAVHSSATGLLAQVGSTGADPVALRYDHGAMEDAPRVWHPDVDTHAVTSTVWARMADAVSSGALAWQMAVGSAAMAVPLAAGSVLTPQTVTAWAAAGTPPRVELARTTGAMATAEALLDDVLTVTDAVELYPGDAAVEARTARRSVARTAAGALHLRTWHHHGRVRLPLRGVSADVAARIEWWWLGQLDLALTLDPADPESVRLCRLVNTRHPLGRRAAPYGGRWHGTLELLDITDGRLST